MILADLRREYSVSDETIRKHAAELAKHFPEQTPDAIRKAIAPAPASQRPLRIAIAAHSFSVGGGEVAPILLANALKSRGHHVSYLVLERLVADETCSVRHRLRPDIPVFHSDEVADPARFMRDYGIEVINSHNVSWEWHFAKSKADLGIRYIATLHGGYETVPDLLDQPLFVDFLSRVDCWLYLADKNLDLLTAKDIVRGNAQRIFNALPDFEGEWVDRAAFRAEHGIAHDAFVMVLCSRAIEEKGWGVAIDVAREATKRSSRPIHLVLIGDGPYLDIARAKAAGLRNVTFLGRLEAPLRYFRCFDVGIFPSTYGGESFPLFLLECFQAGLPVVTTNVGAVPEMMGADPAGVVVPRHTDAEFLTTRFAEAVHLIANDEAQYQSMQRRAVERSCRYGIEKLADLYEEIFRTSCAAGCGVNSGALVGG
jgi:glycosyltransferase involved in cell wall biosynthesis